MADRTSLRLSATLLLIGEVILGVAQVLHPLGGTMYEATFADFAGSSDRVAFHLGQFVGMALFLAGLLVLYFALGGSLRCACGGDGAGAVRRL